MVCKYQGQPAFRPPKVVPAFSALLIQLHLSANERPEPFIDHTGILRDSKTGRAINGRVSPDKDSKNSYEDAIEDTLRTLYSANRFVYVGVAIGCVRICVCRCSLLLVL
ncbi:hypothetical protein K474DRAFT_1670748 [Panus rudis PR-1116 ss-1]|nr:hypothetical protein K474DRAFT_1670748 [Panus rudis PR-1116 ss-1]